MTAHTQILRPRRLRTSERMRALVRETRLSVDQLIMPLFVRPGTRTREPIPSLPGQYHFSVDELVREAQALRQLGVPGVLLFGLPKSKDAQGSGASAAHGIVQQAVRALKKRVPDLVVITDVCLCGYTSHGHCGVFSSASRSKAPRIDNDASVALLAKVAVSHAEAGADLVAPSDMMDGTVGAIRAALDARAYIETGILAYSVKYASAFYGPFRDAAGSAPSFGDRRSYQMDPANLREALREARLDLKQGADLLMVKPALAYLDVIRAIQELGAPVAAYNVSGEYAMVKAAAARGWMNERAATLEMLTAMTRAGADIVLTYWAKEAARWLRERR